MLSKLQISGLSVPSKSLPMTTGLCVASEVSLDLRYYSTRVRNHAWRFRA